MIIYPKCTELLVREIKIIFGVYYNWKPYVRYTCTVQLGRRMQPGMSHKLNDVCDRYGICLNHHQANSDSRACAEILLALPAIRR